MIIGHGHPREVVVVATFVRNVIIEINNVIMKKNGGKGIVSYGYRMHII